ncbi:MAG TPA: histidine phosphatase family protein [Usitatibacteraceae bacterium]|nr:histidine phosphatase family protein [Usitatibacteraceae bacterium]
MPTHLILIRHGETEWNRQGRIQGHSDSELTVEGIAQAEACAARLATERIDAVVSSDLPRAWRTAGILAGGSGHAIRPDPGLRERNFGAGEGLTYAEIQDRYPLLFSRTHAIDADFAPEGGESRRVFHQRVVASLQRIAAAHGDRTVLVVTHGGVLAVVYRWLNALPLEHPHRVEIPNVAINRIDASGEPWQLAVWADTAHLPSLSLEPG